MGAKNLVRPSRRTCSREKIWPNDGNEDRREPPVSARDGLLCHSAGEGG